MLKTSHSVDYFKQAVNRSELIKDTLSSSSQQIPIDLDLPEDFIIGESIGEGDCFFDAVAQGLNQLKPLGTFTAKSLRKICKIFAKSQFGLDSSWLTEALKNDGGSISSYVQRIEFTADDIKKGYRAIDRLKLTTATWGLPEIEGRIICIVYKVRLHFIKERITCNGGNVITHHLIDREGYQKGALDRDILNKEVYYRGDTIHIINRGKFHFEPILRKQMLPNCYNIRPSEKKLDSESICFQQNSEAEMKDVTDNQMDYEYYKESSPGIEVLPTESTIGATVDYEDRLSNEELQCVRSQESPGVTRSSSIGSSSTSTDDEEMFSCISITSDEIKEKMLFFVRVFVKVFEEKYSQISQEVRPDSKILKTGKAVDECTSAVNDTIAPGLFKFALQRVNRFMGLISAKRHKREKKAAYAAIVSSGDNKREILVKAGLEIFQKFEKKMSRVVDDDIDLWEIAIEKLATDAVYRVINYISSNTQEFSVNLITKGVILGRSKDDKFPKQLVHKSAKIFKFKPLESEYKVKDKQSSEIFTTSELYEKVGIKIIDGDNSRCYRLKEHSSTERYGYRLLFDWGLEERKGLREHESNIPNKEEHILKKILGKEYVFSGMSEKSHGYILDEEMEKLANSTLKEISGKNPAKKKDIEGVCERFENVLISSRKKDEVTFSFNLSYLPKFFIKREVMLDELKRS